MSEDQRHNDESTLLSTTGRSKAGYSRFLVFGLAAIGAGLLVGVIVLSMRKPSDSVLLPPTCNRVTTKATHGMVSTTNDHATRAGLAMLQSGGNAFDAAAVVQFMLALVQPQSTGIGGGTFIMMVMIEANE